MNTLHFVYQLQAGERNFLPIIHTTWEEPYSATLYLSTHVTEKLKMLSLAVLLPCFLTKRGLLPGLHSAPQSSCLVLNGGRDRNFDLISLKGAFLAHHSSVRSI